MTVVAGRIGQVPSAKVRHAAIAVKSLTTTRTEFATIAEPPAWLEQVLIGADLASLVRSGSHGWTFGLGLHCTIQTDSLWRIITPGGLALTCEDDGQAFGHPSASDVLERVIGAIGVSRRITAVSVSPATADLCLKFGDHATLEIISTSSGYEAWCLVARIGVETFELVGMGGGGLAAAVGQVG